MKISVIIPTYKDEKNLLDCIKSLQKQTIKQKFEIIVVEDGSKSNLKEKLKKYSNVIYLWKQNGGPASARNMGIRRSKGEYLAFIDSDCLADSEWLDQLFKKMIKNPQLGGVGGKILNYNDSMYSKALHSAEFSNVCDTKEKITSMVPTSNAIFKKKDIAKVGGFKEGKDFFMVEDSLLSRDIRIKLNKEICFYPSALVYHKTPNELLKIKKYYNQGRGFYIGRSKYPDMSFSWICKMSRLRLFFIFLIPLSVAKNIFQPYYKSLRLIEKFKIFPILFYLYFYYWKGALSGALYLKK
jgi:glycosyltransferase involved in cell wall biosynthesis